MQESEPDENGDADAVLMLSIIALFVLIIAWVNYINLSSSRALERAREFGIRKVVGAHRRQLIRQFLSEALLMNFLAAGISILIVALVLPSFNQLTGRNLSMSLVGEPFFWAGLSILFLTGALLSGLYLAFVLSSFKAVEVVKGKFSTSGHGYMLRKILVVFQFTASVAFIAGSILIYSQLRYMRHQILGLILLSMKYSGPLKTKLMHSPALNILQLPPMCPATRSSGQVVFAEKMRRGTEA